MLDHHPLTEERPSSPAPRHLLAVGTTIVVALFLAAVLVLVTGGSPSTLLIGAVTGAAIGVSIGRVALRMLRAAPSPP